MSKDTVEKRKAIVVKFAGDSGDGMQLMGNRFTANTAIQGIDIANFPDFPAEIRAPKGTIGGVSGFQIKFGSEKISTPGDDYDVLVAMNAAALTTNLARLNIGGVLILDSGGFGKKNLNMAKFENNPLEDGTLDKYTVFQIDVTKLTRLALADLDMSPKLKDRSKNIYVLGVIYWMFSRDLDDTLAFFKAKFGNKPLVYEANVKALKAGYFFGETSEIFTVRYSVDKAELPAGKYRGIQGNLGVVLGLIAASLKSGKELFYGSYPITPASDILHGLSHYKNFGVKTFQAEDEIAAVCSAIGAAYGGALAVTGTSGPGLALKAEAMGLAVMTELPLVVVNVQRGGPSTGLPTKTEQSDLLQAIYGRNGEAPMAVVSCSTPTDSFDAAYEACRIALEHMTPVILLSDGYIANGATPWKFPAAEDLEEIKAEYHQSNDDEEEFMPYSRNEKLARPWAIPGTEGLMHRVGGLEKEDLTGHPTPDPENHQLMVRLRAEKVALIADHIPLQEINVGAKTGKVLVLSWGSTYGSISAACFQLVNEGYEVSQAHLRYLNPFPKNLGEIIKSFDKVLIPEINDGQLIRIIRDKYLVDAISFNKIMGLPFTIKEMKEKIIDIHNA